MLYADWYDKKGKIRDNLNVGNLNVDMILEYYKNH